MKIRRKTGALMIAGLTALTLVTAVPNLTATNSEAEALHRQAMEMYEANLCTKSLSYYNSLLSEQNTLDVRLEIVDVYKRGLENGEFTQKYKFVDYMMSLIDDYREESVAYDKVLPELITLASYEESATVLKQADAFRISSETIDKIRSAMRGMYYNSNTFYDAVYRMPDEYYVAQGSSYMFLTPDLGTANATAYAYASPLAGGGALVKTEDYTVLVSTSGVRQAYFDASIQASTGIGDGLIACQKDGKYDYYNLQGEFKFGSFDFAGRFSNGIAAVQNGQIWQLIKSDGTPLLQEKFEDIKLSPAMDCAGSGRIWAKKDGRYRIYDINGEMVSEFECDDADVFLSPDWPAAFCVNNKWGFVDAQGNIVIEAAYDGAKSFSNGLAGVQKGEEWFFIDGYGQKIITGDFSDVDYFTQTGKCFVKQNDLWTKITLYYLP